MHLFAAHPVVVTIVGCWMLAAVVDGMPTPTPTSGLAYRWLFGSLNYLAASLEKAARARFPQVPLPPYKDLDAAPSQPTV